MATAIRALSTWRRSPPTKMDTSATVQRIDASPVVVHEQAGELHGTTKNRKSSKQESDGTVLRFTARPRESERRAGPVPSEQRAHKEPVSEPCRRRRSPALLAQVSSAGAKAPVCIGFGWMWIERAPAQRFVAGSSLGSPGSTGERAGAGSDVRPLAGRGAAPPLRAGARGRSAAGRVLGRDANRDRRGSSKRSTCSAPRRTC
jgi:hypothetical protein